MSRYSIKTDLDLLGELVADAYDKDDAEALQLLATDMLNALQGVVKTIEEQRKPVPHELGYNTYSVDDEALYRALSAHITPIVEVPQCEAFTHIGSRWGNTPEPDEMCENDALPGSSFCEEHDGGL